MAELMKPTAEDWIGDIPESWNLERMRYSLKEINVKNSPVKTEQILSLVKDKGVMLYEEKGDVGNKAKEDITGYKVAYPDTLIVNSMNILIGSVGISKYKGCVSPVYYVFKETEKSDLRYINYIFNTREFQKELRKYANGILEIRLRVSAKDIFNRKIPVPPKAEQAKIADFLDKKCAEIDQLSEDIQRQIDTLNEYKKSAITHAVTKGLNPEVAMKDSGIEWIGKIPENWKITRNKYLLKSVYSGGTPTASNESFYCDDGVPYVNIADMSTVDYVDQTAKHVTRMGMLDKRLKILPSGTLLYSMYATLGHVSELRIDATISQAMLALFADYSKIYKRFYKYALVAAGDYAISSAVGTTQMNLNTEKIINYYLTLPPIPEQTKIANYLDKKCSETDSAIDLKKAQLANLGNYKKSLIYEYATGKKRVEDII